MGGFTANKGYPLPTIGGDPSTWGAELNTGFGIVDSNLASETVVTVGGTDITATAAQAQCVTHVLFGTLTAAINYKLPQVGGFYIFFNGTSGGFPIKIITTAPGSTGPVLPPVSIGRVVWSDGASIYPVGRWPEYGDMKPWPVNIPASGWVICDGRPLSRTLYAGLFAVLGTTWGAGDGSTTFNIPDLRGRSLFGADGGANRLTSASIGVSAVAGVTGGHQLLQSHGHTVTDPGHGHGLVDPGHTHTIGDPGHSHTVIDPGHSHTINDPGHNHAGSTTNDGGHTHNYIKTDIPSGAGLASGANFAVSQSSTGTDSSGTHNHTVNNDASTTGVTINGAVTGASTQNAGTGIFNNGSTTHVTINGNSTGITVQGTGFGNAQNIPPMGVVQWIIYAGP